MKAKQKRGRRSQQELNQNAPPSKRPCSKLSVADARNDGFHHWPRHIAKKQRC